MKHFLIIRVLIEWNYRDTIVNLKSKRVDAIVNNNQVFQVSIAYNSEIFNVIAFSSEDTVLSV